MDIAFDNSSTISLPTYNTAETLNLSQVLPDYLDLWEVLSKKKAETLLLHRPYDYATNLLPRTCLSCGRLFSLSDPKQTAKALAAEFI